MSEAYRWIGAITVTTIIAVVMIYLISRQPTTGDQAYPICFEDEAVVRIVATWDGEQMAYDPSPLFCVPVYNMRRGG